VCVCVFCVFPSLETFVQSPDLCDLGGFSLNFEQQQ